MRRITVQLPGDSFERLRALAERELRDPRSQATALILDGLERDAPPPTEATEPEPKATQPAEVFA